MNTPSDPQNTPATPGAPQLPTGESQIGVVRRTANPPEDGPVLEHSVAVPAADTVPEASPQPLTTASPAPTPAPAPPAAPPVAAPAPLRARAPLQETPKVSIPERMNHLSTENQRLRDELQALEDALKSRPE